MMRTINPDFENRWARDSEHLRIGRFDDECESLGPGLRTVVWVQGCCFRCPGCASPQMLAFRGGKLTPVVDVVDRIVANTAVSGVTFSGGEPFMQATALVAVIDQIRARGRDLSFMSYSGFTLEELRQATEPDQLALLDRLDLLVDGRFRRELYVPLRWRGSSNQKVHFLSDRYGDRSEEMSESIRSLDFTIDSKGRITGAGIPVPGLEAGVRQYMNKTGVLLSRNGGRR